MKVLCRISLFFAIVSIGFFVGVFMQKMYTQRNTIKEEIVLEEKEENISVSAVNAKIDCDTVYMVEVYDTNSKQTVAGVEILPAKYIGMERISLENELKDYAKSPSLPDLEKGFLSVSLVSFSNEKIVVQKNYGVVESQEYYLAVDHNFVIVYEKDKETIYTTTDILLEDLPKDLREEIIHMKMLESEEAVYHFLESHSS